MSKKLKSKSALDAAACSPSLGVSDDAREYLGSLENDAEVVECEPSNCMYGMRGKVYRNAKGSVCVRWLIPGGRALSTSATWGTRKIADSGLFRENVESIHPETKPTDHE